MDYSVARDGAVILGRVGAVLRDMTIDPEASAVGIERDVPEWCIDASSKDREVDGLCRGESCEATKEDGGVTWRIEVMRSLCN